MKTDKFNHIIYFDESDMGYMHNSKRYPNASKYFIHNNCDNLFIYLNPDNYQVYLDFNLDFNLEQHDFDFICDKHKQGYMFIIDFNVSTNIYYAFFFDESSLKESHKCYFFSFSYNDIKNFNEDLKNQILNHTILQ